MDGFVCFPFVGSEKFTYEISDKSNICDNTFTLHKHTYLNIPKKHNYKQLHSIEKQLKAACSLLQTLTWHKKDQKKKKKAIY